LCIIGGVALLCFFYLDLSNEKGKLSIGTPPVKREEITIVHKGIPKPPERPPAAAPKPDISFDAKQLAPVDTTEECEECPRTVYQEVPAYNTDKACVSIDCLQEPQKCREALGLR
jgi:hypothetical protein